MFFLVPLLLIVAALAVLVSRTNSCSDDIPAIDQHGYRIAGGRC